ncbi:MAG TPA: shikimate dehydrogenase [Spirochaetia bacterium]|nr:shikimate dehydrogenase [Spirochaetia bacterium]
MYFVGVHTQTSMIMRVFPRWAADLRLGDCRLAGIDLALHDQVERYRQVVRFIKEDPRSIGALVTTHKIDLLHAAKDLFDELDELASLMGEVSSISKEGGRLKGSAKDPITAGGALETFLPERHWERTRADAFIIGAGGSSIALSWYLGHPDRGANRPARILISNRSPARLEEMRRVHAACRMQVPVEYVLTPDPQDNDSVIGRLAPGSLVANATGLGKDAPGSPVTDAAVFPRNGLAWDFNYRGNLVFLEQARRQKESRRLHVEDGWVYFLIGWLAVIGQVFGRDIPLHGTGFDRLRRIAEAERR